MSEKKRKSFSADFKAKVALEAIQAWRDTGRSSVVTDTVAIARSCHWERSHKTGEGYGDAIHFMHKTS